MHAHASTHPLITHAHARTHTHHLQTHALTHTRMHTHTLLELASDGLKGRVFEVSLADLQNDEVAFRKFRLISEEVQGKNVLTTFHGMTMTTDKLRSLVKKWQVRHPLGV